jgi:hypothetical protein
MIVAVGLSRLVLGVHLPGDVIGGAAFGLVIAWIGSRMPARPESVPRSAWELLVIAAGLGLSYLGAIRPEVLGLLVVLLLVRPEFAPPRAWWRRVAMAAGGLVSVGFTAALLWLPGKASPEWTALPVVAYLNGITAAWVAFDAWPHLWMRLDRRQSVRSSAHDDVEANL